MLPKNYRADKNTITGIFKRSKRINSPHISFAFIQDAYQKNPRISFIVPKSVSKSAVKRNSLRRRGNAVLQKYLPHLKKSISGVFIFGKKSTEYFGAQGRNRAVQRDTRQNLEDEIKEIIDTLH